MPGYWTNNWGAKIGSFARTFQRVENWPTAVGMRLFQARPGPRLLAFRDGMNVICRGASSDWDVVSELALAGGYRLALDELRTRPGSPVVLDMGGNIGVFSLLAARCHARAVVYTYEPAPPNALQCEINRLVNPLLADRIHLRREAVGGSTRAAEFFYDEQSPQSSGFYGRQGCSYPVQIRSFAEAVSLCGGDVELAKFDIEGAEFEVLEETPPAVWDRVRSIAIEIHADPRGQMKAEEFLGRLRGLGYARRQQETIGPSSYFLTRA